MVQTISTWRELFDQVKKSHPEITPSAFKFKQLIAAESEKSRSF